MSDPESLFPALPDWFWYPIVFLYGSIVGSFLNVLIYRLPLIMQERDRQPDKARGTNVNIGGKSYCPNCRNYLKWYHNVPLLAFLALRGRCAFCKEPISWRYFTVELLTGCLWVALYHQVAASSSISWVDFVAQALFASVLIAMIFIDLDHFLAPDELNVVGFTLGLGRDLVCLVMAWQAGRYIFDQYAPQYAYFGWLPRAIPGAITYGGVLYLVEFVGFLYYAREPWESFESVIRRFFTDADSPPPPEPALTAETAEPSAEDPDAREETEAEHEEEEAAGDPPRIRFSPGFLALVSAVFLLTLAFPPSGLWRFSPLWAVFWASLAFVLPLIGFLALARRPGESMGVILRRFFSADDLAGPVSPPALPAEGEPLENAPLTLEEEANQFALEAETGKHGGLGHGDVKLGLAIGAMLGPGMALLSLFFATLLGAVTGIVFTRLHGKSLRTGIPFVPFLAAGAILVMLFGSQLVDWYLVVSGVRQPPPPPPQPPHRLRPRRSFPPGTVRGLRPPPSGQTNNRVIQ